MQSRDQGISSHGGELSRLSAYGENSSGDRIDAKRDSTRANSLLNRRSIHRYFESSRETARETREVFEVQEKPGNRHRRRREKSVARRTEHSLSFDGRHGRRRRGDDTKRSGEKILDNGVRNKGERGTNVIIPRDDALRVTCLFAHTRND